MGEIEEIFDDEDTQDAQPIRVNDIDKDDKGEEDSKVDKPKEDDEDETAAELFEREDEREKFTSPDYVPPPPKNPDRPPALFNPNLVGLLGFLLTGLYVYVLKESGEVLEREGVDLTGSISTTVILLASLWSFLSNLEGWTRFPYITVLFFVCGLFAPGLHALLDFNPYKFGTEFAVFYYFILYGPLFYIFMSTIFAVFNGRNELAHGFKSDYF